MIQPLRDEIVGRAAKAVTIILLVSAVIGAKVLHLFGIGLPAFQVGGGIILFLIAVQMTLIGVSGTKGDATDYASRIAARHRHRAAGDSAVGRAGRDQRRGALRHSHSRSFWHLLVLCGITLLVGLAVYGSLRVAEQLRNLLKDTGIDIATRLMGLLIAAIAAQLRSKAC